MKREREELIREENDRLNDELFRARIEQEMIAEAAAKRRKLKEDAYVKKWQDYLFKWNEMKLENLSGRTLTLPSLAPAGRPPRSTFLSHITPACRVNLELFSRAASELECLNALIGEDIWEMLELATNSSTASAIAAGTLANHRRYRATSVDELKNLFFARFDMIVRGVRSIDEGYLVPPLL